MTSLMSDSGLVTHTDAQWLDRRIGPFVDVILFVAAFLFVPTISNRHPTLTVVYRLSLKSGRNCRCRSLRYEKVNVVPGSPVKRKGTILLSYNRVLTFYKISNRIRPFFGENKGVLLESQVLCLVN